MTCLYMVEERVKRFLEIDRFPRRVVERLEVRNASELKTTKTTICLIQSRSHYLKSQKSGCLNALQKYLFSYHLSLPKIVYNPCHLRSLPTTTTTMLAPLILAQEPRAVKMKITRPRLVPTFNPPFFLFTQKFFYIITNTHTNKYPHLHCRKL